MHSWTRVLTAPLCRYDVYLLSELWMRPDHETIRAKLPPGYFMTAEVGRQ